MSELIVFTFNNEEEAGKVLDKVVDLNRERLLEVEDAAVVIKNMEGRVRVHQTLESALKGGNIVTGGFWGLLVGLIFGGPLFGALLGMGLSALFGRNLDIGVDNTFIKEVGDDLNPGDSAIFMLVRKITVDKVAEALKGHNGTLYHTSLSHDAEEAFEKALQHEPIVTALEAEYSRAEV